MIIDEPRLAVPACAGVFKVADQFALLGIDTDDGQATAAEAFPEVGNVIKLEVPVGAA